MSKDSKICLAGHTGLLGSALLKKLNILGYSNIILRSHKDLDLTCREDVDKFFKNERIDFVFLAAGKTGGIAANKTYPAEFYHVNISIQDNVFQAVQKYEVKNLIFYACSCAYPRNCPQPMKEEYLLTGEIEKTSEAFAIAKIAGVLACRAYNNQFNTRRFVALIPNSMYGPNDDFDLENSHVLSALIRKFHEAKIKRKDEVILWGSGNPRREFVFSEDVADASIFAMLNTERLGNSCYNIGTGQDYSIKELAEIIARVVGFSGKICWDSSKPDGAPRKLLDSSRFLSLGWKPVVSLQKGLEMTYHWFLSNVENDKVK